MNDSDKELNNRLAMAELDPESAVYRQMRLSLMLAEFKVGRPKARERGGSIDVEDLEELMLADSGNSSQNVLSPEDIDMIEALRETEVEEELEMEDGSKNDEDYSDELQDDPDENCV